MDFSDRLATQVIKHDIKIELIDQVGSVLSTGVGLEYLASDPYAVTFVFDGEGARGEPVRWDLARDLLDAGISEPVGVGDVALWPCLDGSCRAVTMVELSGADGSTVLLQVRTHDLRRFLDRTFQAVPAGTESMLLDLDGLVASLLGGQDAG